MLRHLFTTLVVLIVAAAPAPAQRTYALGPTGGGYSPYTPPRAYFLYSPPPPTAPNYDAFSPWGYGGYSRPDTRFRAFPLYAGERKREPALVEVRVPGAADVWFGENKTQQTGDVRLFQSPPLTPGDDYHYDIRARWTEGGRAVERTKRVAVRAGERSVADFTERSHP